MQIIKEYIFGWTRLQSVIECDALLVPAKKQVLLTLRPEAWLPAGRRDGVFYLINLAIKAVRSGICGYIAVASSIVLNIMPLSQPTRQNSKEFLKQNKSMRPNDLFGFQSRASCNCSGGRHRGNWLN